MIVQQLAGMSRVVRFAAWLLLAVWLPATLHCQLEAAGLGEAQHDSCCTGETDDRGTDCLGDACANIENSLLKDSAPELHLAAPVAVCPLCCAALVSAARTEPVLSPKRQAPPLALQVAWQFIERAAPPARAPSLNT
jgi:hypothetical protein